MCAELGADRAVHTGKHHFHDGLFGQLNLFGEVGNFKAAVGILFGVFLLHGDAGLHRFLLFRRKFVERQIERGNSGRLPFGLFAVFLFFGRHGKSVVEVGEFGLLQCVVALQSLFRRFQRLMAHGTAFVLIIVDNLPARPNADNVVGEDVRRADAAIGSRDAKGEGAEKIGAQARFFCRFAG